MDTILEALSVTWDQLSPAVDPTLGVVLITMLAAGAFLTVLWFSIARIVWLHKHPSWTFKAAFDYMFQRSILWLAALALVIGAIWLLPGYVVLDGVAPSDMRLWQAIATLAVAIVSNLLFYALVVEHVRRPSA